MNRLHRDVAGPCLAPHGSVVAIGAFDGVHRGHRAVLEQAAQAASKQGLLSIALSFAPLPRVFFAGRTPPAQLMSTRERVAALLASGCAQVLLLRFDAARAAQTAEEFVAEVLVRRLGAREIWVGEGFRFGRARGGDVALLRRLGTEFGFTVGVVPPIVFDGERVSSSRIRQLLADARFDEAARLLGRRFTIGGRVVAGARLGRRLGYPTANLRLGRRLAPVTGIFAVRVHGVANTPWPGVASLGTRPTVAGGEPLLEAHLFDFDGNLYGQRIEVDFVQKLRDEERFSSLEALARQIDRDARAARLVLGIGTTAGATT
jgi:riboflavin kinase/FMN adenylyltransferase